jgi:hypothetical protein
MQIVSVGIDLGKTTFHLVALGIAGKVLVRKKFTQRQLLTYTANMQMSLIGLEACSGAQGRLAHPRRARTAAQLRSAGVDSRPGPGERVRHGYPEVHSATGGEYACGNI